MDYLLKHPIETVLVALGGTAVAGATGLFRHKDYFLAFIIGAVGILTFTVAEWMMLRNTDWGTVDEWGAVANDSRQRLNVLFVAVGTLAAGIIAMYIGFGPIASVAQFLFIGGGWLVFIGGVFGLATWLQAQRQFG